MARTKQTARKHTGGRRPRKIVYNKPKKETSKEGDEINLYSPREILEPYIKECLIKDNIKFTDEEFENVWNLGIENKRKIISYFETAVSQEKNMYSKKSYEYVLSVLNKIKGPILNEKLFLEEKGFGKVTLEVVKDITSGKEVVFSPITETTTFTKYDKGVVQGVYSVYSMEDGISLISEQGDDIVKVTKRSNGKWSKKGERGRDIPFFVKN